MISFTNKKGKTNSIVFRHNGRRAKRSPRSTTCFVYEGDTKDDRQLVAQGFAKPIGDWPVLCTNSKAAKEAKEKHGSRIYRSLKSAHGVTIHIVRGDMFSYETGRREALTKALKDLAVEDRKAAWEAYFNRNIVVAADDVAAEG